VVEFGQADGRRFNRIQEILTGCSTMPAMFLSSIKSWLTKTSAFYK
jgi:hypothetical protein